MSDQQPPAEQDTAAVAGPSEAPGAAESTPQIDWEKRYQDLQPEYTRTTQQLRELEQQKQWYEVALTSEDPDTRRQAIEALGYELPEDEQVEEGFEPVEYDDPDEQLRAEVQRLREQFDQNQEAARQQEEAALIRAITDERLGAIEGLPKEDQDWVLAYAINSLPAKREPGLPVPLPDVEQAFEVWQQRETARQKQWASTKRAPVVLPGGVTANEVPDTSTHEGRVAQAMQRLYDAENPE